MSHGIALPNTREFCYSDFKFLDKYSGENDICRITKNKNGEKYLSSVYSLKERFIQFLSYIPLLSRMDFVCKQLDSIKAEQAEAVSVFLRVLRDEFDCNSFCSENLRHEERPDFLKCKDISIWLNAAANSTINQHECTEVINKNLADLKCKLTSNFSKLSSESLDSFVKNEIRDNHVDVIISKINAILKKSEIPEYLHVNLREIILEHLNLNALDSEYTLKSISDFICDFMNMSHTTNKKVASLGKPLLGKPFKLSDNILFILNRIQIQTDFNSAGTLLFSVAELKAEIKSEEQLKNEIRSSLHAYTMKNAYMHSLVAPVIPMPPEDEYIPTHLLASQPPSVPAVSSAPRSPSLTTVSLAPPPPPMPLSPSPTSQSMLSSRTSQSENLKGAIQKEVVTPPAQRGDTTGLAFDNELRENVYKRRAALEGRSQKKNNTEEEGGHNENQLEDRATDKAKLGRHHSGGSGVTEALLKNCNDKYPFPVPSDSEASDDSGLTTDSNRSSISGESEWNE